MMTTLDTRWIALAASLLSIVTAAQGKPCLVRNAEVRAVIVTAADHWTLYLRFPLADVAPGGVRPGETLYANIIRSFMIKPYQVAAAWNPTIGSYCEPSRLGKIVLLKP